MPDSEFPGATPERVERRIKNIAKRRMAEIPLFVATGVADKWEPLPTREEATAQLESWKANWDRAQAEHERLAAAQLEVYRAMARDIYGGTWLAELETYATRVYPSPVYLGDCLCRHIADATGRSKGEVFEQARARAQAMIAEGSDAD